MKTAKTYSCPICDFWKSQIAKMRKGRMLDMDPRPSYVYSCISCAANQQKAVMELLKLMERQARGTKRKTK